MAFWYTRYLCVVKLIDEKVQDMNDAEVESWRRENNEISVGPVSSTEERRDYVFAIY